jgi:hypothetical protein
MRAYGTPTFTRAGWVIDAEPHVHMRAKRIFGRLSKQEAMRLTLSHSTDVCRDLEWFLDRYPLDITPADRAILTANATAHRESIARLEQLIDTAYTAPTFDLALPVRDYQARSAGIYLERRALLVGDDVGLGKTVTAIATFTDPRTLPALVVTLTHLPKQWAEMIQAFAPGLTVHVITKGTPYALPTFMGRGPDVVIVNYHKLAGWAKVLAAYCKSVVFDEVQELRHAGTGRYDAVRALNERITYRLGLSATPIFNYGGEIFNVLDALQPGCLGTRREFVTEWCGERGYKGDPDLDRDVDGSLDRVVTGSGEKVRIKNPAAFGAWAREQFLMVRHTRKEVGRELPPVIRTPYRVDADTAALAKIEGQAAELAMLMLRQGPEAVRGERWHASEQLSTLLRMHTGIAKAPFVAQFVRLLLESGERVVLCGWHRQVYGIWLSALRDFRPRLYTGSEDAKAKEAAKDAFITGETPLLILSLRSGAGMNGLQDVSSCIVFGELDWSPGVHEQCIGRLARDGQRDPVAAYYLVSDHGADPAIIETLGVKRQQVEGIRNPGQATTAEPLDVSGRALRRLAESYLRQIGRKVPKGAPDPEPPPTALAAHIAEALP